VTARAKEHGRYSGNYFCHDSGKHLQYLPRCIIEQEPGARSAIVVCLDSTSRVRRKVCCFRLIWVNRLSPAGNDSDRRASRSFNDKAAAVQMKLESQQLHADLARASEVGECTPEADATEKWDNGPLQCRFHFFSLETHSVRSEGGILFTRIGQYPAPWPCWRPSRRCDCA
jgi:hypothetical protein